VESGPIAGVQWFVTAPKHTPTICSQLPCHYYTFTFLLPMPSTVQLPLTSLEVLFMDQVVTFYIFSSFKPQAQKSSYSSSNFQIVSSNLRLLVVQSCCFFQPGLQIENSSCHVRDDFHSLPKRRRSTLGLHFVRVVLRKNSSVISLMVFQGFLH